MLLPDWFKPVGRYQLPACHRQEPVRNNSKVYFQHMKILFIKVTILHNNAITMLSIILMLLSPSRVTQTQPSFKIHKESIFPTYKSLFALTIWPFLSSFAMGADGHNRQIKL